MPKKAGTHRRSVGVHEEGGGQMKEIKFRAWDLERKRMYDVQGINWYDREVYYSYSDAWYPNGYSISDEQYLDKVILMQYTGLKDKNKREIYEGDVIKVFGTRIGYIQWIDSLASFGVTIQKEPMPIPLHEENNIVDSVEIIGNTYENK